jgi:hypothetical protein
MTILMANRSPNCGPASRSIYAPLLVEVFDHSEGPRIQLLYFKERFVGKTHPGRSGMEKFSSKLRKLGLNESTIGLGPDKETLIRTLAAAGLDEKLRSKRHSSR